MNFKTTQQSTKKKTVSVLAKVFFCAFAFLLVFGVAFAGFSAFDLSSNSGNMTQNNVAHADRQTGFSTPYEYAPSFNDGAFETIDGVEKYVQTVNMDYPKFGDLQGDQPKYLSYYRWATLSGQYLNFTVSKGKFVAVETSSHTGAPEDFIVFNTKIDSEYIKNILQNGLATVNVTMDYTLSFQSNNDLSMGVALKQTNAPMMAHKDTCNFISRETINDPNADPIAKTTSLTLSYDSLFVNNATNISFVVSTGQATNRTQKFTYADLSMKIQIIFNGESNAPKAVSSTISNNTSLDNGLNLSDSIINSNQALKNELQDFSDNASKSKKAGNTDHFENIVLGKYVNKTLGTIDNYNYFKMFETNIVDYNATTADDNGTNGAVGIKDISFGTNESDLCELWKTSFSNSFTIKNDENQVVAIAKVGFLNKSKINIKVYFVQNAQIKIILRDFCTNANEITLDAKGIDADAPKRVAVTAHNMTTLGKLTATNAEQLKNQFASLDWTYSQTFGWDIEPDVVEPSEAKLMFFYNVAFSKTGLWGSFNDFSGIVNSMPNEPKQYGKLGGFANLISDIFTIGNESGSGYYIVSIVTYDLAGNTVGYSNQDCYMFKIDYANDGFAMETKDNVTNEIYDTTAGKWLTKNALTTTFTIPSRMSAESRKYLSGNVLVVEDALGNAYNIVVKDGMIVSAGSSNIVGDGASAYFDNGVFKITYADGVFTLTCGDRKALDGKFVNVFENMTFTLVFGHDPNGELFFSKQAKYYIDKNTPNDANFIPDKFFTATNRSLEYYSNFNYRNWFTDSWLYNANISIEDEMKDSQSSSIKVFIGLGINKFVDVDAQKMMADYILSGETASFDKYVSSLNLFDTLQVASLFDIEKYGLKIDLKENVSGLRNIYVWVVDQANNTGKAIQYQMLVDANQYSIETLMNSENEREFGYGFAKINFVNQKGEQTTSFKRGDALNINISISKDLNIIPYKVTRNVFTNSANTEIFSKTDIFKNSTLEQKYVYSGSESNVISMNNLDMEFKIESTSIANFPERKNMEYEYSFRKVVQMTLGNTIHYYNGTNIGIAKTIDNVNANAEFVANFYTTYSNENPSINVPTKSSDGALTEGGAPKDAGYYFLVAQVDGNNYVSAEQKLKYTILKKSAIVRVQNFEKIYGQIASINDLQFILEGKVEGDANNAGLISGSLKLTDGSAVDSRLNVGKYVIVQNDKFEFKNYSVTFASGIYEVKKFEVAIVVDANQSKEFGNEDPKFTYSVSNASLPYSEPIESIILSGNIIRNVGMNVGVYPYDLIASKDSFVLNSNYKITISCTDTFKIAKRNVQINPVTGQKSYVGANSFDIRYQLNAKDLEYQKYISGALNLGVESPTAGTYPITLGTLQVVATDNMNSNIQLVLATNVNFVVEQKAEISIRPKTNFAFETIYMPNSDFAVDAFDFNLTNFEIDTALNTTGWTIKWSVNKNSYDRNISEVGVYPISFTIESIMQGQDVIYDSTTQQKSVFVADAFIKVNPATITVVIDDANNVYNKAYGDKEREVAVLKETNNNAKIDSISISNGEFARVLKDGNGDFVRFGNIYDDVSSSLVDNAYYGLKLVKNFSSSNLNYKFEYVGIDDVRYTISAKQIILNQSNFEAKNKSYDGSTTVKYQTNDESILFSKVRLEDDVTILFDANYNDANASGRKEITFSNFTVAGKDAKNYQFYIGSSLLTNKATTIKINQFRNGAEIVISKAILYVNKTDIEIKKQYDGTKLLTKENVKFVSGSLVDFDLTTMLDATVVGEFASSKVSNNIDVNNCVITMPFVGANANITLVASDEAGLSVVTNATSVVITISMNDAKIVKKEIAIEDLNSIVARDRQYNGTKDVSFTYTFKDGVLALGSSASDVPIEFVAQFDDKNVGKRTATITGWTLPTNPYYVLKQYATFENIEKFAQIVPARLSLDFLFDETRKYNAKTNVTLSTKNELVFFEDSTTIPELQYLSFAYSSVNMSLNGKLDSNVQFNADTTVKKHNVLVAGLVVTVSASAPSDFDVNNFVLYVSRYSETLKVYEQIEISIVSGQTIADFEMLDRAVMEKKALTITSDAITVDNKYFDATKFGTAQIDLTKIGVEQLDLEKVKLNCTVSFEQRDCGVGNRVANVSTEDLVDLSLDKKAGNYFISNGSIVTMVRNATILPAPLTFVSDVNDKVYDGTLVGTVKNSQLFGFCDYADVDKFKVNLNTRFVAFDNKNVSAVATKANLYGMSLAGSSSDNYILTTSIIDTEWKPEDGDVKNAPNYYMTKEIAGVKTHFFKLPTTTFYRVAKTDYNNAGHGNVYAVEKDASTGIVYYIVKTAILNDANKEVPLTVSYGVATSGKITAKQVGFTVETTKSGEQNINKKYDGTNVYHGDISSDFVFALNGIFEFDTVTVSNQDYTAQYSTSDAGNCTLDFNVTKLSGVDSANYSFINSKHSLTAKINPLEIQIGLKDLKIEYGSGLAGFEYVFGTFNNGEERLLKIVDGKLGYYLADNTFVVLDSNMRLPEIVFGQSRPENAGFYAVNLANGSSQNYKFVFITKNVSADATTGRPVFSNVCAVLQITKKVVYAFAQDNFTNGTNADKYAYTMTFGEASPQIILGYSATANIEDTQSIIVNPSSLGAKFVEPLATFNLFNFETKTFGNLVDKNSSISENLAGGNFYAVKIDATNASAQNYEIRIKYDSVDSNMLVSALQKLEIANQKISGISFMPKPSMIYTGKAIEFNVSGTVAGDIVTFQGYNSLANGEIDRNSKIDADKILNVGTYFVELRIQRANFSDYVKTEKIVIKKASVSIDLRDYTVEYDKKAHTMIESNGILLPENTIPLDEIVLTYYDKNNTVIVGEIVNAGLYTVKASFVSKPNSNFESCESPLRSFTISKARISIDILKQNKVYVGDYAEDKLDYEAKFDSKNSSWDIADANLRVYYNDANYPSSDEFEYIEVPGKYSYRIVAKNTNYMIVSRNEGFFYLGVKSVACADEEDASNVFAKIESSTGIVAGGAKLAYDTINSSSNATLWNEVLANVKSFGSLFGPLTPSAMVDVYTYIERKNDSTQQKEKVKVQPIDGTVRVRISLPEGAQSGNKLYMIDANNKLSEMTYTIDDDGFYVVETSYLGTFVFVKNGTFPFWFIGVIVALVLALVAVGVGVPFGVKTAKKNKELVTVINGKGEEILVPYKEKKERDKIMKKINAQRGKTGYMPQMSTNVEMATNQIDSEKVKIENDTADLDSAKEVVTSDIDEVKPVRPTKPARPTKKEKHDGTDED